MPQLDQVTFFSQFFWLCIFFFGFYFLICKDFLPKMGRILKLRKKKMNLSAEGMQSMQQENEKVRTSSKALVENGLSTCGNLLLSHLQRIESWLARIIVDTNKKQLNSANELYVEWVGDNSIRQQIALQAAAPFSTPRIFASVLAEKCKNKTRMSNFKASHQSTSSASFAQLSQKQELLSRPDSLDQPLLEKAKRGVTEQAGKSRNSKK